MICNGSTEMRAESCSWSELKRNPRPRSIAQWCTQRAIERLLTGELLGSEYSNAGQGKTLVIGAKLRGFCQLNKRVPLIMEGNSSTPKLLASVGQRNRGSRNGG